MTSLAPSPAPAAPTSPIPSSAPKPAAPVAPAAPTPAAEAPKPSVGMNDFIAKMGKPAEPAKPDAAPKLGTEAAGVPQTPATPDTQTPEIEVGDEVWEKAPKNLKNSWFKLKRESGAKIAEYDRKIKELEGKSNQSPADLKKIQELEARSAQLEKDLEKRENLLAETSYERSAAYKKDHLDKWDAAAKRIGTAVSALKVKVVDGEGNETERLATGVDIDRLRAMDAGAQDDAVNQMFGKSAYRVFGFLNELDGLERDSKEAVANAKSKSDETRRTGEKQYSERSTEFKSHAEKFKTDIETAHAEYFAPDPSNPEASDALQKGFEYVDNAAANQHTLSPKDLAETTTMIRYLAASAPRLMKEKTQLKEKVAALETELSKYRKSSPNSATPSATSVPVKTEARGISAMVDEMLSKGKQ